MVLLGIVAGILFGVLFGLLVIFCLRKFKIAKKVLIIVIEFLTFMVIDLSPYEKALFMAKDSLSEDGIIGAINLNILVKIFAKK